MSSKFDEYSKARGQECLEEIDVGFSTNTKPNNSEQEKKGTGLYMVHYVETDEEKASLADLLRARGAGDNSRFNDSD